MVPVGVTATNKQAISKLTKKKHTKNQTYTKTHEK